MGKPRSGIQVSIYNTPGNEQCGPTSCARVITRDTKRMNDICEYISECSSVTSADIKGVLEALYFLYRQGNYPMGTAWNWKDWDISRHR